MRDFYRPMVFRVDPHSAGFGSTVLSLCSVGGHGIKNNGGGRVLSLDTSFGLLETASASAPALFLGSALCCCGVNCMICG